MPDPSPNVGHDQSASAEAASSREIGQAEAQLYEEMRRSQFQQAQERNRQWELQQQREQQEWVNSWVAKCQKDAAQANNFQRYFTLILDLMIVRNNSL